MTDRAAKPPDSLYELEASHPLDGLVQVKVSKPFKAVLKRVASEKKISVSDLVRMALNSYLDEYYPPYYDLYKRLLEEAERSK